MKQRQVANRGVQVGVFNLKLPSNTSNFTLCRPLNMQKRILIVEDEAIIAQHLSAALEDGGYEIAGIASSVNKALQHIEKERPFLVILDIYLKGELTGIHLAQTLNKSNIPFIYVSANCTPQILDAAKATHPYGFIVKPFRPKDLLVTLDIALYHYEHDQQLASRPKRVVTRGADKDKSRASSESAFDSIVGESQPMLEVFDLVRQVGPLDTSVLILGESGTGKEGIATALHKISPRKSKPFIKLNCAALPIHLIESELFGHEKGAFTGAIDTRIGKFEMANGGTIFLDEIGEMSQDLQVKLLRVLQERQIERVGGGKTINVDVRVITATHRNLEQMIAAGNFRLDLYYRLNVFPILVPPLRARSGDIAILASFFVRHYSQKIGRQIKTIDSLALRELEKYPWPGNVREMQNVIERAVLLAKGDIISTILLPNPLPVPTIPGSTLQNPASSGPKTLEEMEREHIIAVLKKCNNRVAGSGGAAEYLNLPPSTLYSRIKKLGIPKNQY
jgi:DNA-binding NtrC family response regulator